jgi:hypothetical protein
MSKNNDKSAPHGVKEDSRPTKGVDLTKTPREALMERLWGIREKQEQLLNKHLKEPWRYQYAALTAEEFWVEDYLKQTDAQLLWDALGGHKRCPIAVPESLANIGAESLPLTKLCEEKDCPSFKDCPATKQTEIPIEYLPDPEAGRCNFYDDNKHPCPHPNHMNGCHPEDCEICKIYENSPGSRSLKHGS